MQGLEFSADGHTLATKSDDGRVLLWDVRSGAVRETLTGHSGAIPSIVGSADGRTLYTGGLDDRIIVWDIRGDRRLGRSFQAHPLRPPGTSEYPPALAISPSGRIVAAGRPDGGVSLFDSQSMRHLRDLPGIEAGAAQVVEFSPDGRAIAVTGAGGAVELRDVATGRPLRRPLPGLGAPAQAMGFSPDGGRLAVADVDGNLRMLEVSTGAVRRAPRLPPFPAHLTFSPDGETLAIALDRNGTQLLDGRSLRALARLPGRPGVGGASVRFAPDGLLLAVTGRDGSTQFWDPAARRRSGPPLRGHEDLVTDAEFSPDGRMLATSGVDGTVILRDLASRRALGTLPGPASWTAVRFARDGRRIFVLRETGAIQRWEVSPDAWSRYACRVAGRELTHAEWDEFVPDQDYRRVCGG